MTSNNVQTIQGQPDLNSTSSMVDIQWNTYNSSKLGFSIEYPASWAVYEKQSRFEQGTDLRISSPILTEGRFDVVVIDSPPTRNLQVLTNFAIQTLVIDYYNLDYEMRLIENSNFTRYSIDGERSGSFVSLLQDKEQGLYLGTASEVVVTLNGNKGYILQFVIGAENFDTPKTTEIREHMFNSIKWTN